jgi:predicted dienelactone hydrolase
MVRSWRAAFGATALLACLLPAAPARAGETAVAVGGLAVTVWQADTPPAAPQPVVIFSHGFHGCATQSRFLMRALADAGFLVLAPNHRDATCDGGEGTLLDPPERPFTHPEEWSDAVYRDRADDIADLVVALHTDPAWRGRIDWGRLALAGHSLGGYTVLGLAGAWPSWRLAGVRAVLALSPYSQPFMRAGTLRYLAAAVMYQGGTLDLSWTPTIDKIGGSFAASPAPKYLVRLRGATHLAWTDLGRRDRDAIIAYSVAFLQHALNGAAVPILYHAGAEVAELRFAEP